MDGEPVFPPEVRKAEESQIFEEHMSTPSPDPETPVDTFILGSVQTIEAHLLHHSIQQLLDQGTLTPADLDQDTFADPDRHQLREPSDHLYYHDQQIKRLRSALEESTQ